MLLLMVLGAVVVASTSACAYHASRTPTAGKVVVERKTPLYESRSTTYRSRFVAAPPPRPTEAEEIRDRAEHSFEDLRETTGDYHGEVVARENHSGKLLLNIGSDHGVRDGAVYTARDPKTLEFSGEAHVVDVQRTSSMARVTYQTSRGVRIGDVVQPRRSPINDETSAPPTGLTVVREEERQDEREEVSRETKPEEPKLERPSRTLSKQNVIDMVTAGISESNIRLLVQRSWVDFDVDSDTVIELKRVGMSDELLEALILRIDEQEELYD